MGEHLKHLFFILKCVVYVYVCFSDLLHPACVDVVQVGSLLWCLHLHKNTHTNTSKPVRTRTTSHEPQWFKIFINNHHKSHDRCAESYIWLDYFSCNQKKLRWRVERVKIISCSSGMLPLSRKWIHAAARLHKHQRDSKSGCVDDAHDTTNNKRARPLWEHHRATHNTVQTICLFCDLPKTLSATFVVHIFSTRAWNLKLVTDQSSSFTVVDGRHYTFVSFISSSARKVRLKRYFVMCILQKTEQLCINLHV